MSSAYLTTGEAATWGVSGATDALIGQASTLIDQQLRRTEGLAWVAGADGSPCYMKGLDAVQSYQLQGSISPGDNVTATVSGAPGSLAVGDVLIADAANTNATEALTIAAIAWPHLTFKHVAYAHAANALLDAGRVIVEKKNLPKNRPITLLAKRPLIRIHGAAGRYGMPRRGDSAYFSEDFNMLASLQSFGGPPIWEAIDPLGMNFEPTTGEVWVPSGLLLAYYTEVRCSYVAGYPTNGLPSALKEACAMVVKALQQAPPLANVKAYKAGNTAIQMFTNSIISEDVRGLLTPFAANAFA